MYLGIFDDKNPAVTLPNSNVYPVKEKSILKGVILTALTCGLYGIIWGIRIDNDSAAANSSRERNEYASILKVFLFVITFGFYGVVWSFFIGLRINAIRYFYDLNDTSIGILPFVMALLYIPTFGLSSLILSQYYLNQICQSGKYMFAK